MISTHNLGIIYMIANQNDTLHDYETLIMKILQISKVLVRYV